LPPGTEAQKEVKPPAGKTLETVADVAEAEELPAEGMAQATRILVVEDDPKTANLIGYWLQQEGYQVDYAADGIQAIEKAKSTHPFAVCLDIMLPKRDGWQVLHQLKSDPSTADVGVIICSALDNPDLGFALGAADYCVKPLSRRPLLDKLRHLQQVTPSKHSQPQVLVADSDLKAAEATAAILERQGFAVVKAHNSAKTKEKALEYCPDVIILDLKIAGASSYDVISFLQKHPLTVDIPVVVTTDKSLSAQEEQILDKNHVEKVIHKREDSREQLLREIFRLEKLHPERAKMVDPETRLFNRRYF
jgi:DNA-binding response OmpR family regulator